MRTLAIRAYENLRQVDHRVVIARERIIREIAALTVEDPHQNQVLMPHA